MNVIECGACWAKAVRQVRPHRGAVLFHTPTSSCSPNTTAPPTAARRTKPMPDLFARPLGPDGKPTGPMRRLGSNIEVRVDPGARDQWAQVEKILTRPNPYLPGAELTFTIQPGDEARVMSLFHGGPTWLWTVWLDGRGPAPLSRGTAWRDGALAACVHQLTGPPEPPRPQFPSGQTAVYPRWYLDWLVWQMRRAYDEHPELFDPRAWTTGDLRTDLTASQLAEQRPGALRLYDRNWHIATDPGAAVHAPPRTVARDYPPPAEPCKGRVVADPPPIENVLWSSEELSNRP